MGQKRVVSRKPPTPDIGKNAAKVNFVRIADIYVFSCEGPVWVNLLFKQRFIDVHCYQLCQAEELL